jgi:predicted dithiol-disulfide oxidoreductase (DUF899 family)
MTSGSSGGAMNHRVVSRNEWIIGRTAFLAKEKEFTRLRDELSRERRELPWVKIDKQYAFDGPRGKESLAQLFESRSQLVVYHFMFSPEWEQGCKHCSFWADHFDGMQVHLNHRDVTMVAISRAPLAKLEPFKKRMGWRFKWVSSFENDFNHDFNASFTPDENQSEKAFYNFAIVNAGATDREGVSVFFKDESGTVYHTYSCYARGIDILNGTYNYLDLVPKGRDEDGLKSPQAWVQFHDRYE